MKELTSYNRVAGYLNKVFDLLNEEFFESELSRPTKRFFLKNKGHLLYNTFNMVED